MTDLRLPTGRAGQLAAAGLTLLVIATLWWGIVDPVIDWHAGRADFLARRTMLLQRMDDLAATLPALKRQAAAAPADEAARPDTLLQATSDATASAELQQRVQDMAAKSGVVLTSVETLTGHRDAGLRQIALHVAATATWGAARAIAGSHRAGHSADVDR